MRTYLTISTSRRKFRRGFELGVGIRIENQVLYSYVSSSAGSKYGEEDEVKSMGNGTRRCTVASDADNSVQPY